MQTVRTEIETARTEMQTIRTETETARTKIHTDRTEIETTRTEICLMFPTPSNPYNLVLDEIALQEVSTFQTLLTTSHGPVYDVTGAGKQSVTITRR